MLNIKLSEVIELFDYKRKPLSKMQRLKMKGNIPYYGAAGIIDYVNESIFEGEYILLAEDGTVKYYYINILVKAKSNALGIIFIIIIIIILVILAGAYYLYKKLVLSKSGDKYEYE